MTEAVTINNEELAILCDIVSGRGVKKWAENPGAAKKQSLDRLIAHGYVEPVHEVPPRDTSTLPRQRFFLPAVRRYKRWVSCPATSPSPHL
jgi:hypothetical protein